ncbi:MAG: hypothetical protein IOD12_03870 [Silvanigrellales bacterium]|nr:hypothetical protein [Silvanigrellales bacterium]
MFSKKSLSISLSNRIFISFFMTIACAACSFDKLTNREVVSSSPSDLGVAKLHPAFRSGVWGDGEVLRNVDIAGVSFELVKEWDKVTFFEPKFRYRALTKPLSCQEFASFRRDLNLTEDLPCPQDGFTDLKQALDPRIQALDGFSIDSESLRTPEGRLELLTQEFAKSGDDVDQSVTGSEQIEYVSNCWQTVFEMLKPNSSLFALHYPPELEMDRFFKDPEFFASVDGQSEMSLGDVFYISGEERGFEVARHAAIHIASGLYFERVGAGSDDVWRITTLSELKEQYPTPAFKWAFLKPSKAVVDERKMFSVAALYPKESVVLGSLAQNISLEMAFGQGLTDIRYLGHKVFKIVAKNSENGFTVID